MQERASNRDIQSTISALTGLIDPQQVTVKKRNQFIEVFSWEKVYKVVRQAITGFETRVDIEAVLREFSRNIYSGITSQEVSQALVLSTLPFIQYDPVYSKVAMRLLSMHIYKIIFQKSTSLQEREVLYRSSFGSYLQQGVTAGLLDSRLLTLFDIDSLVEALKPARDELFEYMGLYILYDKYLLRVNGTPIEAPQYFWMRIAMGLALGESKDHTHAAIRFYDMISQFRFVTSTPTLLHSGTTRSQLSSCYLTTISDDLHHIFKCLSDNAQLAKYSGGVANDWTNLRASGSVVKSIDVQSHGVIPFLKLVNDVTTVINRSGKRRGATAVYLETWHYDIEDFLDLRRNTGDERRRAHDIHTANWIPDLFMKRVERDEEWTLFSPQDTPDLHGLYGKAFEARYEEYERAAQEGTLSHFKRISAKQLWKKMLARLFETGHPWITFKDAFNIRSPQDHVGVINSTNLCTEIGLNTSAEETAVCNLGSINLAQHMHNGILDTEKVAQTLRVAMRMLDNVVDINFYPTKEAAHSNKKHRPVGLGIMGLQDALYMAGIPFDSPEAVTFCDTIMEYIAYHAISASCDLAAERGAYETFKGSKWDRGIFPLDTLELLEKERGEAVSVDRESRLDWELLKKRVSQYGMRNSNTMAIAPTATISNISGCVPCIEPLYKNLYVKANKQGEFTVINRYLVAALEKEGLWTPEMREQLTYFDGSVQHIPGIPDHIKHLYKTAFELDPLWMVQLTAVRAKWIDQSQSHNVFMQGASGKKLNDVYFAAWKAGMKSTYYLRTLGASQIEKSTLDASKYGFTQKRNTQAVAAPASCSIDNPDCESCQ